jgi:hypothetical protein
MCDGVLPRWEDAVIPIEKFTKYALDPKNSKGKHVAFQRALGYNLTNADMLVENIRQNVALFPAVCSGSNQFGNIYVVLMRLSGPNGKTANVITAWLDDNDTGEIRLVSAYVKKRKDDENG